MLITTVEKMNISFNCLHGLSLVIIDIKCVLRVKKQLKLRLSGDLSSVLRKTPFLFAIE